MSKHPLDLLPQREVKRFGWRPDTPDPRDLMWTPGLEELKKLPVEYSLRSEMPPLYDQGQLGSCTANAIGSLVQHQQMLQKEAEGEQVPSRLFIYYGERVIENSVDSDAGAEIRDGMKVVGTIGAPPETDWPYDIAKFAEKPPTQAFTDAKKYLALKYARVRQSQYYIKASIFMHRPVVIGFLVYESFEDIGSDGIMPMPAPQEQILGGHAVKVMGYNDTHVEVKNSWGGSWGDGGYFWMPWQFLLDRDMCSDFWTISLES
jgi:C1A family cysteine protease